METVANGLRRCLRTGVAATILASCSGSLLVSSVFGQDQTPPPVLGLPQHENRDLPEVDNTLPKAAQPDREKHKEFPHSTRQNGKPLIPGQPGRALPDLEDVVEGEVEEPESPPGLFLRMPHEFAGGAITGEYIYTAETFTLAKGGINDNNFTNYRHIIDMVFTFDTAGLGMWEGGRFFLYGHDIQGKPMSLEHVGDWQLFSNIDSTISDTERPYFTTIGEYWYEHLLLEGALRAKIGKQDANVDFAYSDLGGEFVHSSFGLQPTVPLPTYPSQGLGTAFFYSVSDEFTLAAGVYDGTLAGDMRSLSGFQTMGHNGAISLYQAEWKPQSGPNLQLPTTIRVGMWHSSNNTDWVELTDGPNPRTFSQNYGTFASLDQMVFKESYGDDDDQGLGVFFMFGWAPEDRNALSEYYGAGFVYKGFVEGRDEDTCGAGVAHGQFGSPYRLQSAAAGDTVGPNETAIELFYKVQCSQYFTIQPDFQIICNPSGMYKDALVPGIRASWVL